MSLNKMQRERLDKNYESIQSANERTRNENELRRQRLKRTHNNVGNTAKYTLDKDDCLAELSKYNVGDDINFTQLGLKYNLKNSSGSTPSNAGQN